MFKKKITCAYVQAQQKLLKIISNVLHIQIFLQDRKIKTVDVKKCSKKVFIIFRCSRRLFVNSVLFLFLT